LRLGLKLVAASGNQAVAVPAGRTLVVGRSPACDVPIRDLTVSRHHGEIEAAAAGLRVRDLGSTNGTFINGARISEGVAAPGARVAFGKVHFQVMEERATDAAEPAGREGGESAHLAVVDQVRIQALTEIASLLVSEQEAAAAGRHLRVSGDAPAERRAAALALLLEIAKELSQQGEPARVLDKAARLLLQALRVDRVEILTRGDEDEMVPRVSKVRPGGGAGSGRVPRLAARKAAIDRVAVLIAESATAPGTDAIALLKQRPGPAGSQPPEAAVEAAEPAPAAPDAPPRAGSGPVPAATTDAVRIDASGAHGTDAARAAEPVRAAGQAPAERRGKAICAPLLGMQASVLGLLYLVAEEEALGREELEFVGAFAGVVAVTLENLSLIERARAEAVAQAGFQRQFTPFVADQVAGQDDGVRLDGVRRRLTCLCCEIRGVAELAEELPPEETARLLREFFSEAMDVVFEHGGTLDRFTGSGLTAFWGAPLSSHADADEAVQAAIGMQRGLERLNGDWGRQQRRQLAIATGIDLGEAFAGNVGSERRLEFTAIGRPVEGAAALCAAAGAGEVLVSEELLESLASPPPVESMPAAAPAQPPAAAPGAGVDAPRPAGAATYRIDWRTPPTLRQSGEVPQPA